jgi:hypothetical protein
LKTGLSRDFYLVCAKPLSAAPVEMKKELLNGHHFLGFKLDSRFSKNKKKIKKKFLIEIIFLKILNNFLKFLNNFFLLFKYIFFNLSKKL